MNDQLFLELTSRCTLACPACPRTMHLGTYKVGDLPIEVVSRLVKDRYKCSHIILSGNHGDPIYHPRFHEILRLLTALPGRPTIGISTNGSYRSEAWWTETASILGPGDNVTFGIDGLRDTASIYRRNMDWDSTMTGIKTLKRKGTCFLTWQWILFRYNEDQLKEARKVLQDLGVDKIMIVKSFRDETPGIKGPTITLEEAYARFNG